MLTTILAVFSVCGLAAMPILAVYIMKRRPSELHLQDVEAATRALNEQRVQIEHYQAIAEHWKESAKLWRDQALVARRENGALLVQVERLVLRLANRVAPDADEDLQDPPSVGESDRRAAASVAAQREAARALAGRTLVPVADAGTPPIARAESVAEEDEGELGVLT